VKLCQKVKSGIVPPERREKNHFEKGRGFWDHLVGLTRVSKRFELASVIALLREKENTQRKKLVVTGPEEPRFTGLSRSQQKGSELDATG